MSEQNQQDERTQGREEPGRRTAPARPTTHRSWWPGWIWAVPIAALAIGAWLLIRWLSQGGTDITISFSNIYGLDPTDTDIVYRGMTVGKVDGVSLTKQGDAVNLSATINESAKGFLKEGTVFWLKGAQPSLSDLSSLGSILSGPKIVMAPGTGKATRQFKGIAHEPIVAGNAGPPLLIAVSFDGPTGSLSTGDIVKLRGFSVGEVREVSFEYDVETGKIRTPVTLALYPGAFHIEGMQTPGSDQALRAVLDQLVSQGLRAKLDRDPPLIGGYRVALEMIPGAPKESMNIARSLPEIPTAPEGGGLESIVNRVKNVPIKQIGQNVLEITRHIDEVVSSPKLKDSVAELDAALKTVNSAVEDVAPKVDKLVTTLRDTAQELDRASATAQKTMGGAASQTGLQETLREIKEAAEAVRSLADYLDRHPEALISGRSGG